MIYLGVESGAGRCRPDSGLTERAAADHQLAVRANSDDPAEQVAWRRLTARHGDRLNEIMDEYGWPTAELVGEEAARAAWLIAHADRQLDVQRRAHPLMRQAVPADSADPREPAFLREGRTPMRK
ncbi:hypothetical protein GCM10017779_67750 [Streptomyces capillispiralis]|uniref:Uncharacterized protein n=1 Tax=Streptomyces capillispiralis TaxID=68182 RepID=A0A561SGJ6_9ACTN|nr:DUF6624 domain-containing protein [Streptomyces capillispiralis]TWF73992.1 hypothetical protein FHX78_1224 [Streptomyces capillispiralis]GHH96318.1 hypothetical protein GCM10017779_67750 [Streptomyces capillispiralis]